ncbi:threonylcarbamoyl-AMP synthase [Aurantimicrobium sp. INA4]|uniref:L-threonylcarbamoyladenylate synthase n=1 Tax=Aurantimicrobium sp. INA4 TaxID=2986279 RepID=UPI0024923815|nr:L-threonylcarbamoyladenylate synthase [Aurantimicrobium sp. INA4]BDU11223.1 threonylcarbamoyl-AMP synthase [Aurantimicrobium sp. INA4]
MSRIYDCSDNAELLTGTRLARQAVAKGQLVVLPTDTVYGVGANAFSAEAVQLLLEAKGRGRQSPPPVLMPSVATMDGLAQNIPDEVRALADAFWPGGLTIILEAQPSLAWDLGDTNGTVAVRVPSHPVALELLAETGPLAVSSANLTGQPAAVTAQDAHDQLGARVEVYLDGGEANAGLASTIVDATALSRGEGGIRILRDGVISAAQLREVIGDVLEPSTDVVG